MGVSRKYPHGSIDRKKKGEGNIEKNVQFSGTA